MIIYKNATFSFDDMKFPVENVMIVHRAPEPPELPTLHPHDYVFKHEAVVPVSCFDFKGLERMLLGDPQGASRATLAKRVLYGGRKARSARRRLLARGCMVEERDGSFSFHGRAAWAYTLAGQHLVVDVSRAPSP